MVKIAKKRVACDLNSDNLNTDLCSFDADFTDF